VNDQQWLRVRSEKKIDEGRGVCVTHRFATWEKRGGYWHLMRVDVDSWRFRGTSLQVVVSGSLRANAELGCKCSERCASERVAWSNLQRVNQTRRVKSPGRGPKQSNRYQRQLCNASVITTVSVQKGRSDGQGLVLWGTLWGKSLVMRTTVVEKSSREIPDVVLPVRGDRVPQKEGQRGHGRWEQKIL